MLHFELSTCDERFGQSRRFAPPPTTSGLPPTADITLRDHHFRNVPTPEVVHAREQTISVSQKVILCDVSRMAWLSHSLLICHHKIVASVLLLKKSHTVQRLQKE